jgi:hypothetical protein
LHRFDSDSDYSKYSTTGQSARSRFQESSCPLLKCSMILCFSIDASGIERSGQRWRGCTLKLSALAVSTTPPLATAFPILRATNFKERIFQSTPPISVQPWSAVALVRYHALVSAAPIRTTSVVSDGLER